MNQPKIRALKPPGGESNIFFGDDSAAAGNNGRPIKKQQQSNIIFDDEPLPVAKENDIAAAAMAQNVGAVAAEKVATAKDVLIGGIPAVEQVASSMMEEKAGATSKDAVAIAEDAVAQAQRVLAMAQHAAGAKFMDVAGIKAQDAAEDFPQVKGLALVEQNGGIAAIAQDKPDDFKIGAADGGAKDAGAKIQGESDNNELQPGRRAKAPPGGYSTFQLG